MIKRLSHGCCHIGPISSPLPTTALGYASSSYETFGLYIRADVKTAVWQPLIKKTPNLQNAVVCVGLASGQCCASAHLEIKHDKVCRWQACVHPHSPGEYGWLWTEPVSYSKCSKLRPLAFPDACSHPQSPRRRHVPVAYWKVTISGFMFP